MPDVTRIIEQTATETIYNDDWIIKDSATNGTTKIQASVFKAWINDGMATVEELETAVGNIADTYNISESYVVDDLCIHEYALYKCIGATTGTWDSTKWQATTIAEIIATIDLSAEAISYDNTSSGLEARNVQDAIGETITKLSAVGSASGAIATFDDGSDLPMPKLEVAIEPVQDLHGYDNPWVGGAGKNKLPMTPQTGSNTINGITWTVNDDGSIKVSGTATARSLFYYLPAGSYGILNGEYTVSVEGLTAEVNDGFQIGENWRSATPAFTTTYENATIQQFWIDVAEGTTVNTVIKPMIRLASVTDATFEPYSNICPISGHTEANVTRTGKNLFDKTTIGNGNINDADGAVQNPTAVYKHTDYIKVVGGESYYIKTSQTSGSWGAWYDKNKNYISGIKQYADSVITAPSNAVYMRLTILNESYVDSFGVNYPSTDTTYHAYNGQTYTIDLDGTRYGGELDVVNGGGTDRLKYVDMGDITWSYDGKGIFFVNNLSGLKINGDAISSAYKTTKSYLTVISTDGTLWVSDARNQLVVHNNAYTSASDFKTAMSGVQLVYELATPITYQLTPTQVKSLLGVNNIWADTGDVLDAEYIRDMTTIINSLIARIEALENQ